MASSDPSVLELSAVDDYAWLQLYARALPYRPLRIGGRQRAEFTWYPGSSGAIVQMLGPSEEPIQMNGFWKDRFIGASTETQKAMVYFGATPIYSVTELVSIVDNLRRSGRKFKLSWDKLVRYGHITAFTQTWHTPHDCEWELEFSVSAQEEEAAPVVRASPVNIVAVNYQVQAEAAQLPTENPLVTATNALRAATFAAQQAVQNTVNQITGIASDTASRVLSPFAAARALSSTLSQSLATIAVTSGTITDRAIAEYFAFAGGQDASPIGQQVASYSYINGWRSALNTVKRSNAAFRYETERQMQSELIAAYTAEADTDFRDVSLMFYGTQDSWRDLMLRNNYATSRITAGSTIWVPQRTNIAGESGSAGSAGRPVGGR